MQGATAIPEVLFGDRSPSGRLPVTFYYNNYSQLISPSDMHMRPFPGRTHRFLRVAPLFPFGFGLSYTQWSYKIGASHGPDTGASQPGAVWLQVDVTVTNAGKVTAEDAVLLFLSRQPPQPGGGRAAAAPAQVAAACQQQSQGSPVWEEGQPLQSLVGFGRVSLVQGASITLSFRVTAADVAAFGSSSSAPPACGRYYLRVDDTTAAVDLVPMLSH